jgi:hypothetical protein
MDINNTHISNNDKTFEDTITLGTSASVTSIVTINEELPSHIDSPVKINLVIPLKNRGKHMRLLLENIQNIVNNTHEQHIKVWIGDFHSTDINLPKFITQFTYPIELVLFNGVFMIGKSLQVTAEKITNRDEIIYFCDADSSFPDSIFSRIREHTVKNVSFYVPMVSRQSHSGKLIYPFPPNGHGGKGNLGVYVDDFIKSGGWSTGFFYQDATFSHNKNTPDHINPPKTGSGNPFSRKEWGKHDEHIFHLLLKGMNLTPIRPREKDQFIRWHPPRQGWGK